MWLDGIKKKQMKKLCGGRKQWRHRDGMVMIGRNGDEFYEPNDSSSNGNEDDENFNEIERYNGTAIWRTNQTEFVDDIFIGRDDESYELVEHNESAEPFFVESYVDPVDPDIAKFVSDGLVRYHAGSHGLQAAEKGTLFMSLPPVLFLHLLRFQFDGTLNQVMKNNNYFEFSEHLDLTEFVREDESTIWKYTLFAVLSHSGGGSHGHYVADINQSLRGQWFKFDDDKISIVLPHDAIDSNFGSNLDDEWSKSTKLNAYMLVYVRDSLADDVFEPMDPKYICEEMKSVAMRDPDEQIGYNLKKYYTTDVFVILSTAMQSDINFQFTRIVEMPRFSVHRNLTTNGFKEKLLSPFHLTSADQIRVWRIVHKGPLTHPAYLCDDDLLIQSLESRDFMVRPYSPPLIPIILSKQMDAKSR